MIHEIRVSDTGSDPKGAELLAEMKRLGLGCFTAIRTTRVYRLQGTSEAEAKRFAEAITDVDQTHTLNQEPAPDGAAVSEVAYKPGVMNPVSASLKKIAHDLGITLEAADSSIEYRFYPGENRDAVREVLDRPELVNKTVQRVVTKKPDTLLIEDTPGSIEIVRIRDLSEDELIQLSRERELHLNLAEMLLLQDFARKEGRELTDAEVEMVAQYWSEHCKHKTFAALLETPQGIKRPLMERLKEASALYQRGVISAFGDNSGVVWFFDDWAINAKVETHNSPSAIEPYGGAATGVGGVLRDINGTGKGAKPILSTDMFCFAPPSLDPSDLPKGCLPPDYLLRQVVAGVRDYGNRMGVPTANGSIHFHPDFRAKPTVIVGAYGILPTKYAEKGKPQEGDLVLLVGGRTGRDGIHGATFSSGEMTEMTAIRNGTAVQIGNAIEEKRMFEAILLLRDQGIIRAITDCGAGGLSSAVGEMGERTGVHLWAEEVPLKYSGLAPREVVLSESQERMVLAVEHEDAEEAIALCRSLNVEATVVGKFTDTERFVVTYKGETVADLPYAFLKGLPQRTMPADWQRPVFDEPAEGQFASLDLSRAFMKVLGDLNVCSKEPIVRMYDHSVQGTSALPPFTGVHHDGPSDACVLRPVLGQPWGLVVSHGMDPILNRIDPYWGSVCAAVEALANLVAVGGNPVQGEAWLIDNFIWPFPDAESLGALDLSMDGLIAVMNAFGIPCVSGKDSLSSTYRSGNTVIKIPPVLCVSAFGRIPNVRRTVSADFKRPDSRIVFVGLPDWGAMGGSVLYDKLGYVGNRVPRPDLARLPKIFRQVHEWKELACVRAAHDISEGGLATALAEMCFGGDMGATIYLDSIGDAMPHELLFNQTPGGFLLEMPTEVNIPLPDFAREIGYTTPERTINVYSARSWGSKRLVRTKIDDLKRAWQEPMREVFHG